MFYFVKGQKMKYTETYKQAIEPYYNKKNNMKNFPDNQTPCPLTIYSFLLGIALIAVIIYLLCRLVFFKKHKKTS